MVTRSGGRSLVSSPHPRGRNRRAVSRGSNLDLELSNERVSSPEPMSEEDSQRAQSSGSSPGSPGEAMSSGDVLMQPLEQSINDNLVEREPPLPTERAEVVENQGIFNHVLLANPSSATSRVIPTPNPRRPVRVLRSPITPTDEPPSRRVRFRSPRYRSPRVPLVNPQEPPSVEGLPQVGELQVNPQIPPQRVHMETGPVSSRPIHSSMPISANLPSNFPNLSLGDAQQVLNAVNAQFPGLFPPADGRRQNLITLPRGMNSSVSAPVRVDMSDGFIPSASLPAGNVSNQVSLYGMFQPTRSLINGQIVSLFETQNGARLTWDEAFVGSYFQVIQVGEFTTLLQRYWWDPDVAVADTSRDAIYLLNERVPRVFTLNDTGIRSMPLPNRQLEVVLPPVSAYTAAGAHTSLMFGASDSLSNQHFSETAVTPRDETLALYNLWHNHPEAVRLLLGRYGERRFTAYARMAGIERLGGGLQTTRGYSPEFFTNLVGLNFVYSGTGGWSFFDTMTEGQDFRSVGGLLAALGNLVQALSSLLCPSADYPMLIFRAFYNAWQERLTSQENISMRTWDIKFIHHQVMRSLIRLSLLIKSRGATMTHEEIIARLSQEIIPSVNDLLLEYMQSRVSVNIPAATVRPTTYTGRGGRGGRGGQFFQGRGAGPVYNAGGAGQRAGRGLRQMPAFPPAPGWVAGTGGQGAQAVPAAGNRLCITHVMHILGVGSRGPCAHTNCRFYHVHIPSPCPASLKARLTGLPVRDVTLRGALERAVGVLP